MPYQTARDAPLLLDDPFVHFDSARVRFNLGVIASVAAYCQVLVTDDHGVVPGARDADTECGVIPSPAPLARAAEQTAGGFGEAGA